MRRLEATETVDLYRVSSLAWRGTGNAPGFIFDIARDRGGFLCFFLKIDGLGESPRITFDQGGGFTNVSAFSLKSFPFAFYHVPADRVPEGARVKFSPCARPTNFRFVAFQTSNAIAVAVLHFLFNLRYQDIGIIGPTAVGDRSRWKSHIARITKFFTDVAKGRGLRVQESGETLADLTLALSLKTSELQKRMDTEQAGGMLLSFIAPVFNTAPDYLRDLVDSFVLQKATYAELILSDDGSTAPATRAYLEQAATRPGIKLCRNAANRGIAAATNAGIALAHGRWIAFIDHDDAFVAGAPAVIADATLRHPDAHFFYTDELIVDRALKPIGAFLKPAYDSVLLSGVNYINHFSIYSRDRLLAIGCLREDREGSQDYDLLLRYLANSGPGTIVHIPFVAYLWRREAATYSHIHLQSAITSARAALQDAYRRSDDAVDVEPALDPSFHRVRLKKRPLPLVSVVIPNRDSPVLIGRILSDLLSRTTYPTLEIVVVDNGTTDADTLDIYQALDPSRTRVDTVAEPFNFARMCNRGAKLARGEAFLFLNNDIEVIEPDWLAEMVECLAFDATGIVGAKLLYPDETIQHNGVIVGLGEAAGHWYTQAERGEPGPMGRFLVRQTLSAVTAACMLVTRDCFERLDGFDETAFAVAYNDVDFCLRARNVGIRTVWTPFATLTHRESVSRGSDEQGENHHRFLEEKARLQARHGTAAMIDDAYSPFYDRREPRPYVIVPDLLPALRPNKFS